MFAPDLRQHRRCQAGKPPIDLSEFPEPALTSRGHGYDVRLLGFAAERGLLLAAVRIGRRFRELARGRQRRGLQAAVAPKGEQGIDLRDGAADAAPEQQQRCHVGELVQDAFGHTRPSRASCSVKLGAGCVHLANIPRFRISFKVFFVIFEFFFRPGVWGLMPQRVQGGALALPSSLSEWSN